MRDDKNKQTKYINRQIDMSLLVTVIFLICFGLIMIYSTSSYEASMKFNDAAYFLKKQLLSTGIGLVAMAFFAAVDFFNNSLHTRKKILYRFLELPLKIIYT